MATAKSRASLGLTGGAEEGIVYGKRDNIKVPDADDADSALTTIETAAALRETDRFDTGGVGVTAVVNSPFLPDQADYTALGAERTVN